jgi:wyosine [tRNA(Phe)-imidazoG37] synthetase (radical SAM superfamily)
MVQQAASIVEKINPAIAYISIPTRPPTIQSVHAPSELTINEAFHTLKDRKLNVELLLNFEGTNFGNTGNIIEDIVNISTVHPIREDAMLELLQKNGADTTILNELQQLKYIKKVRYKADTYYIRYFHF